MLRNPRALERFGHDSQSSGKLGSGGRSGRGRLGHRRSLGGDHRAQQRQQCRGAGTRRPAGRGHGAVAGRDVDTGQSSRSRARHRGFGGQRLPLPQAPRHGLRRGCRDAQPDRPRARGAQIFRGYHRPRDHGDQGLSRLLLRPHQRCGFRRQADRGQAVRRQEPGRMAGAHPRLAGGALCHDPPRHDGARRHRQHGAVGL